MAEGAERISEDDEEEVKVEQEQQPSVSHLLREESIATFMEHVDEYTQVEWLLPKTYTSKEQTLSMLCLVAAGAEESAVFRQMNRTAEHLILYQSSLSLSLYTYIYIYIYIYICRKKFGTNKSMLFNIQVTNMKLQEEMW